MAEDSEIKLAFIKDQLELHGDYLSDLFQGAIDKLNLKDTETLLESIDYSVKMDGRGNPVLQFTFPGYGRFIEIRYYKSRNRAKFERNVRQNIWGLQERRRKSKNTRWYTRNVYGSLNRLISRLQSEFSKEEIARLKRVLESEKQYLKAQ
jgi:hypothetical protein